MKKNKNKNTGFKAYLKELFGMIKELPRTILFVIGVCVLVFAIDKLQSLANISQSPLPDGWGWLTVLVAIVIIIKSFWKPLVRILKTKDADWKYYLGVFFFLGGVTCYGLMWLLPAPLTNEGYSTLSLVAGASIMLGGLVFVLRPVPKTKK